MDQNAIVVIQLVCHAFLLYSKVLGEVLYNSLVSRDLINRDLVIHLMSCVWVKEVSKAYCALTVDG